MTGGQDVSYNEIFVAYTCLLLFGQFRFHQFTKNMTDRDMTLLNASGIRTSDCDGEINTCCNCSPVFAGQSYRFQILFRRLFETGKDVG